MLCPEFARNLDAKNGGNSTFARFKSPDPVLPNEMPLGQAETGWNLCPLMLICSSTASSRHWVIKMRNQHTLTKIDLCLTGGRNVHSSLCYWFPRRGGMLPHPRRSYSPASRMYVLQLLAKRNRSASKQIPSFLSKQRRKERPMAS